ncbi:hypothetical protein [Legionella impletisoli]|uniref:Uncharacterized protein n=1 Tax=Legionella impletisoli TaxID=343510 RepID=A0A917K016_9GAMM|nr:hypothetical protein [Legionella impletisoli]GGI90393.1 hypothetical protein GCM10007966_18930 [Legionella impletisoli]
MKFFSPSENLLDCPICFETQDKKENIMFLVENSTYFFGCVGCYSNLDENPFTRTKLFKKIPFNELTPEEKIQFKIAFSLAAQSKIETKQINKITDIEHDQHCCKLM